MGFVIWVKNLESLLMRIREVVTNNFPKIVENYYNNPEKIEEFRRYTGYELQLKKNNDGALAVSAIAEVILFFIDSKVGIKVETVVPNYKLYTKGEGTQRRLVLEMDGFAKTRVDWGGEEYKSYFIAEHKVSGKRRGMVQLLSYSTFFAASSPENSSIIVGLKISENVDSMVPYKKKLVSIDDVTIAYRAEGEIITYIYDTNLCEWKLIRIPGKEAIKLKKLVFGDTNKGVRNIYSPLILTRTKGYNNR